MYISSFFIYRHDRNLELPAKFTTEESAVNLLFQGRNFLRFVGSTKCKNAQIETALCIAHANEQVLGIYRVIRQMAL